MRFHDQAKLNVGERVAALSFGEPAIRINDGGYALPS
jgi:hypothetical protein